MQQRKRSSSLALATREGAKPLDFALAQTEVTIDTAIRGVWMNEQDHTEVTTCLVKLMEDLVNYFNVPKAMNGYQMAQTAIMITEKYPEDSLEFVALTFRKAKLGELGAFFGRIDGEVIFTWLGDMSQQQAYYLETIHRRKKGELDNNLAEAEAMTSEDHKVGDEVLRKMKERMKPVAKKEDDIKPHTIHTAENEIKHVRIHMKNFTKPTLETFKKQMTKHNESGVYTEVLAEIEEALK